MNKLNTSKKLFQKKGGFPEPGSEAERNLFNLLQEGMKKQYSEVFNNKLAECTVVINPSLTLDMEILSKVKGAVYYEERLLCLLMLLRMPLTKIIFLSSVPVPEVIIDYYLNLLPGITGLHARKRLTMLSCYDASVKPLTQKILERPRLIETIRQHITNPATTHLTCFNITPLEKTLAIQLGIPLFGTDPDKFYEGSKSGGRKSFREAGVLLPQGFEDLSTKEDVIQALAALKRNQPALRKAVVKMNEGFSGDGNAIYRYPPVMVDEKLEEEIGSSLALQLKPVVKDMELDYFFEKFSSMEGIVEEFLEGDIKMSPSVQCVIGPDRQITIASTHDQLLGGDDGQVFIGAIFPASEEYNISLAEEGKKIAETLAQKGAMGRFAVDFISVKQEDNSWKHYAIEINLRKGGTTHPYLMLQFLTDGKYNAEKGEFLTAGNNKRYYFASDNVYSEHYKGLTPVDLIDIAMFHSLIFDGATQEGVMFHLIGALSEFGKFGMVCIGSSPERAKSFYDRVLEVLDMETM
jgi:hypothetical protein